MNPSSQRVSTEIRKLLASLNEDNYDSVVQTLTQYIEYGPEESTLLVESCFHHFKMYKKNLKSLKFEPAVVSLLKKLIEKPHFCKVFSDLVKHTTINEQVLYDLSTALKLSPFEKLGFGLALSNSENNNVRISGRNFCKSLFDKLRKLPERGHGVLLLEMAHVITPQNLIQHEVSSGVLPMQLKDTSMSGLVLNLWHVNPRFLSRALNAALNFEPENMSRVVDMFQESEILIPVLDLVPVSLGIRLAAVASQKEYINLEEWLRSNLSTFEDMFYEECERFLKEVECGIQEASDRAHKSGGIRDLFKEATPTFSKVLQEHNVLLSSNQVSKEMESLHVTSTHNSLMMENISDPDPSTFEVDADYIETEATDYFQQMFSGQLTVGAMVQMLMRFKGSSQKREQMVYDYMISDLLQLNKFFTGYPVEQLQLAAILFGLLIRHQVVSDSTRGIALQTVLDALHEPADSKIYIFGAKALENFVDCLIDWPEYCQQLLKISPLQGTHSELVKIIEQTLGRTSLSHSESDEAYNPGNGQQRSSILPPRNVKVSSLTKHQKRQKASLTPSSHTNANLSTSAATSSGPVSIQKPQSVVRSSSLMASSPEFRPPSRAVTSAKFVSARIGTLLDAAQRRETTIQAPESETQDRISFMFNTLSTANIEAKAKEFTEILEEQYYPWFAQYLVMKRVSTEPNFHMVYMNFLEKANSKPLMAEILRETYENCKVLLRSELIQASTEERLLLKNLGGWLGKITIGKNKVLLSRQIDPKSLIIEAYEKGLMIAVVPFTCTVLEPCKGSIAYQPPNPWTMAILGLLAEIYAMPHLKANLTFSIEILFKKLDLDLKTFTRTSLLKDKVRQIEGNPDFSVKDVTSSQPITAVNQVELPKQAAVPSYQGGDSHVPLQHAPAITSGEDINTLFQRVLPMVMENAIKEVVSTTVEKTVSIATHTTMALLLKDYVNESDENYIESASSSIIACLAGNLSYVTSKEPLRKKMSSHLRNSLQGVNIASEFLERVINDNLESGCVSIEKAAIEKGLIIVKKEVAHQLSVRRIEREAQGIITAVPVHGHLLHPQQQVYQDFHPPPYQIVSQSSHLLPRHPSSFENAVVLSPFHGVPAPVLHVAGPSNVPNELVVHQQRLLPPLASNRFISNTIERPLTTGGALDEYHILAEKINLLIAKDAKEPEIQSAISEVPVIILRCTNKEEAALVVAQTVFEALYENAANSTHVNAHLAMLADICDVSKLVGQELTYWVLHSADEIKFNKEITVGLIHRELLNMTEYDAYMAKLIAAGKSGAATEFCISLLRTLEASDARLLSTLQNVIDALVKVTNNAVVSRDDDGPTISSEPDPPGFQWQVSTLITDWCRVRLVDNDESRAYHVLQLVQNIFSKGDDIPDRFFRLLMELAVSHYLSCQGTKKEADDYAFVVIDIYTELVFSIFKFWTVDQESIKLSLFPKALVVIVRNIKKEAEKKKESFISTPYFRLFINFFNHLRTLDSTIQDANFQILAAISNSFHALQPLKVPAFSFTWVELISHKDFMPQLFALNGRKGWPYFKRLLVDLLQFMEPFLRAGELTDPVRILYKGTLRVLLILVHDFSEFICYYHFSLCQVIATRCIQLRNMILSTFPSSMRLPDPNSPNLKVDLLAEMSQPPCIDPEFVAALKAYEMKNDVHEYLMMRPEQSSFLFGLQHKLLLSSSEAQRTGTLYNVPLLNSLVLYVGAKAIQQLQASTSSNATSVARFVKMSIYYAGAALDIYRTLILHLTSEGRYLFFNAVVDQIRYPNNHTHFFSFVLLHFFVEIKEEAIQEQITRVLLERLLTKLPHPWGVQVTFIELVKNPKYNFWDLNFTRNDPDIKRVFDAVSTSLNIPVQDIVASEVL